MAQQSTEHFNYKRAIGAFLIGYILITAVGASLTFLMAVITNSVPAPGEGVHSKAFTLAERFLPLLNLITWTGFAALYFRKWPRTTVVQAAHVVRLGLTWLALALVLDYVCFVLIKSPASISAHDFYIGQMPWIYLIYLTVIAGPLLYTLMRNRKIAK